MHTKRVWLLITLIAVVGAAFTLGACGGTVSSASSADVQFLSPNDFSRADYVGKNIPTHLTDRVRVLFEEVDGVDSVFLVRDCE